jgi:broad specificity phosphatase PhoE
MVSGGVYVPALYVVRHGEPSVQGVMLGRSDPPLSKAGRAQMQSVRIPVQVMFTSPLRRARESADLIAGTAEVIVLPELTEIGLGDWDGKAWQEIEASQPELAREKLANWTAVTPPGGEPWPEFESRVRTALEVVRARRQPAAIVAHIAVNACIAACVSGADAMHFQQKYGQVYEYQI